VCGLLGGEIVPLSVEERQRGSPGRRDSSVIREKTVGVPGRRDSSVIREETVGVSSAER
jgi:hypothetical protein